MKELLVDCQILNGSQISQCALQCGGLEQACCPGLRPCNSTRAACLPYGAGSSRLATTASLRDEAVHVRHLVVPAACVQVRLLTS